jgi:tRNA G18 (ribose-2'-O)-methylase SpoU
MIDFTSKKFLSLTRASQHKKCAELVRRIYDKLRVKEDFSADLAIYRQFLYWMKEPSLDLITNKTLSDCYHRHNDQAGITKKEHNLLPLIRTGDKEVGEKNLPIAIYLDHLRSAHNVGSIIRTMEAFSLGSLYFSADTPFINNPQVKATAMGADEWVSCYKNKSLSDLPHPIIALETSEEAKSIYDFTFPETFTLVLGNEEYGCSEEALRQTDFLLEIPLRGRKNSLNVANAFAIAASEIIRQYHGRESQ